MKSKHSLQDTTSLWKQILWYTVLFSVTIIGVYLWYWYFGRTFLRTNNGNFDGIAQAFPTYTMIHNQIAAALSGHPQGNWNWTIGLGDDNFELLKSKYLNPLTYLIALLPVKYLDIGYTVVIVLRMYLVGLAFVFFGREIRFNTEQILVGAISYTFAGWLIVAGVEQAAFLNAAIVLPLMILGIERLLKGRSPLLFIISVALFFVAGVLWTYAGGIIAVLYFLVRYPVYQKEKSLSAFGKSFGAFVFYGLIGIAIAATLAISMVLSMSGTTISTGYKRYGWFYTLKDYLTWPVGFTSIRNNATSYSLATTSVVGILFLPMVFRGWKRRSTAAIFAGVLFIAALFPVTGSIFNGFSYSVGRWYFIFAFFLVWATVEAMGREENQTKKSLLFLAVWMTAIGLWNGIVCYKIFGWIYRSDALCSLLVMVFGLLLIAILYLRKYGTKGFFVGCKGSVGIVGIVMLSVMCIANFQYCPIFSSEIYNFPHYGGIYRNLQKSTQKEVQTLQRKDTSFYRTDQVDGNNTTRKARVQANENVYFGNRSIYMYFSNISSRWLKFNKLMGNNAGYFDRTTSFSNDNRAALDYLMGVKYFLGDNDAKRPGADAYVPYGFQRDHKENGVVVWKNRYFMGLGASFGGYITQKELEAYDPLVREQVLLQAVVVSEKQAKTLKDVHHYSKEELQTAKQSLSYHIENKENITFTKDSFTVSSKPGAFDIVVEDGVPGQLMLSLQGVKRTPMTFEQRNTATGKTSSFKEKVQSKSFIDDEEFAIVATKGMVEKAARYRKGKNQALLDIEDFNINMGYYENTQGRIHVKVTNEGTYSLDSLNVYSMPMAIYDRQAKQLQDHRYKISKWSDDQVVGTVTNKKTSIVYFSILDTPGWEIYVDGKKAKKLSGVNTAFTGVKMDAGKHTIRLQYHSPWMNVAWVITAVGIILAILVQWRYRRKEQA